MAATLPPLPTPTRPANEPSTAFMATHSPRTEDVMSGGGTFSACLERAIRRPLHPPAPPTATAVPPPTSLVDAISRSTSSDAANQDAVNANSGYVIRDSPQGASAAANEGARASSQDGAPEANTNDLALDDATHDWTAPHASYPLLRATLNFFSARRAGLRARLRDQLNNEPYSTSTACGTCNDRSGLKPTLSEEEFNLAIDEYASEAPFLRKEDGDQRNLMEYAGQRALGRTPPGGKTRRTKRTKQKSGEEGSAGTDAPGGDADGDNLTATGVLASAACAVPIQTIGPDGEGVPNACSPYLRMGSNSVLDEAEIIKRLSYIERSELSAVLDSEVERAAAFYRSRMSELAPPRVDGGTCLTFQCGALKMPLLDYECGKQTCQGMESVAEEDQSQNTKLLDDDDELVAPSQEREHRSFTELGGEILELHAFVTTNIIVVRQVLIKYDAFARSWGGTTMSAWYQTTRRQKVKGRSSDFRDLVNHSKLKKLTKAYIQEYKRHEAAALDEDDVPSVGSRKKRARGKRRLRGLSRAFYRIVDAGEEYKRKQRLKWRQSAMHLDEDDDDEGDLEAPVVPLDGRIRTPPPIRSGASSDSLPATPLPPVGTSSQSTPTRTPPSTARGRRRDLETPPPERPLQPPDYSHLRANPDVGEDIAYQVHIFKCVQSKTQRSIEKTYTGHISGAYDNFISTLREYFVRGSVSDNLSLMPEYLVMRGKSLKSSLLVVAQWREARDAHRYGRLGGMPEGDQWFGGFCGEPHPAAPQPCTSYKDSFALVLNILACFLYMMNYYIVEPSSTRYANALGTGDAMSGLIIGAMPWAAISSAVVYSVWSNTCYRAPLLTSGVLLTAGNILYASAYRRQSITMALCGRFLTGLGGPRSMNRRYIADTTPLASRTAVNAAFGTATAMGAALGPATAIMLDSVDVQFDLPLYGTVYFNGMTGPGFVMGCLWVVFTLVLALTFDEPERSGLQEQIHKELIEASPAPTGTGLSEYEMSNLDASKNPTQHGSSIGWGSDRDGEQPAGKDGVLDSFGCPTEDGREICPSLDCQSPGTLEDFGMIEDDNGDKKGDSLWQQAKFISNQLTLPVRICMFLLFSKMFTVESVISAASMVTKNRYSWAVHQVGTLGTIVGCLTIPISIFIGWVSQYREDRVLMVWLMSFAAFGMALLVDVTDFVSTDTETYNEGHPLAVGPHRYIAGYLLVFCSVQAFDGVVGSVLSKVIPTALATGTLNSGLLATVIGTFGRACGDVFITSVGYINLRQIMNLLFVPSFIILVLDLILICYNYDSLTA